MPTRPSPSGKYNHHPSPLTKLEAQCNHRLQNFHRTCPAYCRNHCRNHCRNIARQATVLTRHYRAEHCMLNRNFHCNRNRIDTGTTHHSCRTTWPTRAAVRGAPAGRAGIDTDRQMHREPVVERARAVDRATRQEEHVGRATGRRARTRAAPSRRRRKSRTSPAWRRSSAAKFARKLGAGFFRGSRATCARAAAEPQSR